MSSEPVFCWCCQELFPEGDGTALSRVWLDQETCLPVCRKCWETIPPADRVRLAISFRDRGEHGLMVHDVLEWVRGLLSDANVAGNLPIWLRDSDNLGN